MSVEWVSSGISRSEADGRYIKRFVGATLAGDTATIGAAPTLYNPNGPVMGLIPADASALIVQAGDGGRFATRLRVIRAGSAGTIVGMNLRGTFQAPTQNQSGDILLTLLGNAVTDAASVVTTGNIQLQLREAATPTAFGSQINFRGVDVGTATEKLFAIIRGGGAGIAELVAGQVAFRQIPAVGGSLQNRNPLNTGTVVESGSDTWAMFGGTLRPQRAAIPNPAGGAVIDVEARAAIVAILDNVLRGGNGFNFIAT